MKIYELKKIGEKNIGDILLRNTKPILELFPLVSEVFEKVKAEGDKALTFYAKKFDNTERTEIKVSEEEINEAAIKVDKSFKQAVDDAYKNILKYHYKQKGKGYRIKIANGIYCGRKPVAIENVGLYIPGGNAVLISTLLMLAIPAKIAGCKRIVVSSPIKIKISPELAYTAKICEINELYSLGGVAAIAMFGLGTESIKKVDKIFGPGNQYVTSAKMLLPILGSNTMIDMPAGPSEVMVIADRYAKPEFVAADLLSQAEHGYDSQAILLTDDLDFAKLVIEETQKQLLLLPRKDYAKKSLEGSFCIVTNNLAEAVRISNEYAPEHLIINTKVNKRLFNKVTNAGSVFLGAYACESAGDYASGTNHSLPTSGFAKATGGVGVEMFMKNISYQTISKQGISKIAKTIIKLAESEGLEAHANAVKVRLK